MAEDVEPCQQAQAIATFDGRHPLIVFDGICVLCSGFARFVVRFDAGQKFRFATAQSPLGEALYREHGLRTDFYETNLVIVGGVAHQRMDSMIAVLDVLGWPWRAARVLKTPSAPDPRLAVWPDCAQPLRAVRQEGQLRHTFCCLEGEDHWLAWRIRNSHHFGAAHRANFGFKATLATIEF